MPASNSAGLIDTPPLELAARIVLAGGVAIWLAMRAGPLLIELLIPYLQASVGWLDSHYSVEFALTYRTGHDKVGSELALLGRAAVDRLFFIPADGQVIAMQAGQVLTCSTAVGVLMQPAVAIVALVLGWPLRMLRNLPARTLMGTAMLAFWFLAGLPATLWLYFHDIPLRAFAPGQETIATPLGRLLLNGGSVALGVAMGALAIYWGALLAAGSRPSRVDKTGIPVANP